MAPDQMMLAALDRCTDRQAGTGRSVDGRSRLTVQVLNMHDRHHQGAAQFCEHECCRTASSRRYGQQLGE